MQNRRKSKDLVIYIARILSILSWILFLIALVVSYYAAPEHDWGWLRYKEIEIRDYWATPLTGYLYIMLWVAAFCSYVVIMISHFRERRASDDKHYNSILLFVITCAWLVYLVGSFG